MMGVTVFGRISHILFPLFYIQNIYFLFAYEFHDESHHDHFSLLGCNKKLIMMLVSVILLVSKMHRIVHSQFRMIASVHSDNECIDSEVKC